MPVETDFMTDREAQETLSRQYDQAALAKLSTLVDLVISENERQNLIAPSTISEIWGRHILDSAQLIRLAPVCVETWMDVGSGAGFPGLVTAAILHDRTHVTLVEPRRQRAEFLTSVAETLNLSNVTVAQRRVEQLPAATPDVISARAVASLDVLFQITTKHRTPSTVYVLPKGASGAHEIEQAQIAWQGLFHVEQSVTNIKSTIIVAREVAQRCSASR